MFCCFSWEKSTECSQNPGLVNEFSATPRGHLNWTGRHSRKIHIRSRTPLPWNFWWILVFGFGGGFFGGFCVHFFGSFSLGKQAGKNLPKNPPKNPRFSRQLFDQNPLRKISALTSGLFSQNVQTNPLKNITSPWPTTTWSGWPTQHHLARRAFWRQVWAHSWRLNHTDPNVWKIPFMTILEAILIEFFWQAHWVPHACPEGNYVCGLHATNKSIYLSPLGAGLVFGLQARCKVCSKQDIERDWSEKYLFSSCRKRIGYVWGSDLLLILNQRIFVLRLLLLNPCKHEIYDPL